MKPSILSRFAFKKPRYNKINTQSANHRFLEKLEIKFNEFSCNYELWQILIDKEDKLYPIHWQWLENQYSNKDRLKYFARKEFPELFKGIEFC